MTQSWLLVGADISCSSQHFPVRAFFPVIFALLEVLLIVSIAFGRQLGSYTRAYIVYLILNISSKSVRVGAKDIFPISRNTFDKTKPVEYM